MHLFFSFFHGVDGLTCCAISLWLILHFAEATLASNQFGSKSSIDNFSLSELNQSNKRYIFFLNKQELFLNFFG
jgi:hypothetical protein